MKIKVHFALISSIIFLFITLIITNIFSSPGEKDIELTTAQSLFRSDKDYIDHLKNKVNFEGIDLNFIKIKKGDNFWTLSKKHKVNIDTMIGANPHWNDLLARLDQEVVIPNQKGVIHFIQDLDEVKKLSKTYDVHKDNIIIQKLPPFYEYFYKFLSNNEPIAVFIKNTKPSTNFMTNSLAKRFEIREMFRSPLSGRYSSTYGRRIHPIFRTRGFHNGLDIAVPNGRRVGAARKGKVISAGWMGGYGKAIIIQHDKGYKTLYGHLSRIFVRPGQHVSSGRIIGRAGSTGWSTGPHLHFTIWKHNRLKNPMDILW